jgi:pyridoxal phosphate-dependent aminotransferase EpsN
MTTSGGGMIVSDDRVLVAKAGKLATQARDAAPHYQHSEWGYNYRLSNVLAGIGRGQLAALPQRIERRREIFAYYRRALADLPGVGFMPEPAETRGNRWLTCITLDPAEQDATPAELLAALDRENIEGRPLWKPLHQQPVFASAPRFGGAVSERLFARGLCLPSGSAMTDGDLDRVVTVIRRVLQHE